MVSNLGRLSNLSLLILFEHKHEVIEFNDIFTKSFVSKQEKGKTSEIHFWQVQEFNLVKYLKSNLESLLHLKSNQE